ncbi:MAG: hypothetical protein CSA65_09080 [Proteobacteria bacterium]|nr:MAG: hypothetical protein CSA65_09080 [Pseudomonadota bacterium]
MSSWFRSILVGLALSTLSAHAHAELAIVQGEPGSCAPPCRSGYICQGGKCVSLCNPPCPSGQRCVKGECELMPRAGEPTRSRYFALLGGTRIGLNDPALTFGELRGEVGSRWVAFQLGGGFGDATSLRGAVIGHISYQPSQKLPLFIQPRLGLGYAFSWVDAPGAPRQQDVFVTTGVRLRWDILRKMAILFDPVQLEVTYLRLESDETNDLRRISAAPVHWGIHLGIAFIY